MTKKFSDTKLLDYDDYGHSKKGKGHGGHYARCYESHPPLPIGKFMVYGGSCINPIVHDADIYVGLDLGMRISKWAPWRGEVHQSLDIPYPITDMRTPHDPADFKKMIEWLAKQIENEKKVHVGCIGGHGRTGTVFSALVNVMTGEVDATTYVRNHYCKKAVESDEQVKFLAKHFGIKEVAGAKMWESTTTTGSLWDDGYKSPSSGRYQSGSWKGGWKKQSEYISPVTGKLMGSKKTINPMHSPKNIWNAII